MNAIENYKLFIDIDSTKHKFEGTGNITGKWDGTFIELDSVELDIHQVSINGMKAEFELDKIANKLKFMLPEGNFNAEITYSGQIPKLLTGFYTASYNGGEVFTTQFESTGARRMFPCLDRPNAKARFQLSVKIDSNLEAISNTPVEQIEKNGKRKIVTFEITPIMSTYLVYVGVGKFRSRSRKSERVEIILSAPEGYLTKSDFPINIASRTLSLLQSYFGIIYPLPKLHLIYVPEFSAGAMENWGAITFRDYYLSIDQTTSSANYKAIAEVIAHELVHQWFGNLVTMDWWNDLWLNESFATFLSYKMIDKIYPEWNPVADQFTRTGLALFNDSLINTHPIDVKVDNPGQISQIFDNISYGKGAAILRMIETYLGETNFKKGLRKYIIANMYKNAKGSELWNSLEKESKVPVSKIMSRWIEKPGYPVIIATIESDLLKLEQFRFKLNGLEKDAWPVPLSVKTENGNIVHLMETESVNLDSTSIITLNRNTSGFYRVLYRGKLLPEVLSKISSMDMFEKWGILNDYYSFLSSSLIDFEDYLKVLASFKNDMDPMVLKEISSQILKIHYIRPDAKEFRDFALSYLEWATKNLGERLTEEAPDISIARGAVAMARAVIDSSYAMKISHNFAHFSLLDPDMKLAYAVAYASSYGKTSRNFNEMMKVYNEATAEEDKLKIITALGWMQSEEPLNNVVSAIEKGEIKKQNVIRFYTACSHNVSARKFLAKNMKGIVENLRVFYSGSRYTSAFIEDSLPYLSLNGDMTTLNMLESINGDDIVNGIERAKEIIQIYTTIGERIK